MIRCLLLVFLAAVLGAADGVALERAWSRATAPNQTVGALFGVLRNPGADEDRLQSASCALAAQVEIHEHAKGPDGVMQMRAVVGGLAIPGHGTIELKPGSYHLMLFGLKEGLAKGGELAVTLVFAKAGRVEVKARINPAWAMGYDETE